MNTPVRRIYAQVSGICPPLVGMEITPRDAERFHEHANPGPGCWIWQGYADRNGYGRIYHRSRRRIEWAHRFSYELAKGPIEPGHEIDHTCQTTLCVNPAHLDQVTKVEHARRTMQRLGKDDRHLAAAHLRLTGMSLAQIAEALSYSGEGGAGSAIQAAIAKGLVDPDEIPKWKKLSDEDCEDIRLMYAFGISQPAIALFYDIDSSAISRIVNGKRGPNGRKRAAA